jgi:hypothetical protein
VAEGAGVISCGWILGAGPARKARTGSITDSNDLFPTGIGPMRRTKPDKTTGTGDKMMEKCLLWRAHRGMLTLEKQLL